MTRRAWSERDRQIMREHYPHKVTREVADMIGCSVKQCYAMASLMGLRKSDEYLDDPASGRFLKGVRRSPATEFKKGQASHNKGKEMSPEVYAKCAPTMFKKGHMSGAAQHNYVPIGTTRVSKDGVLEKKVSDDPSIYPARRWQPVARIVWESANGPIPTGHIVRFKDGMHTTIEGQITIDRLECISKSENMRRNSIHAHGPEIARIHQLRGAITRKSRNLLRKQSA